jgi:NAD(P)H-dependent FMN reductase
MGPWQFSTTTEESLKNTMDPTYLIDILLPLMKTSFRGNNNLKQTSKRVQAWEYSINKVLAFVEITPQYYTCITC